MAEQNIDDLNIAVKIQVVINDPEILTKPLVGDDMVVNTNKENLKMIGLLLSAGFETLITAFHNSVLSVKPISKIDLREENLDIDITFTLAERE